MKFGIYGAAGQTTCASRVGGLYHERVDAQTYADWGAEYLKYDNCGEVNVQSYAKFSAMSDALNATGKKIFFSYEPHLTEPIAWTQYVGNAWRTGHDIGSHFSSMFSDLAINNAWATVGGVGGWNDADMLEVGNKGLTLSEQRAHFALWCLAKSPLLIGSDVRSINASSLAILKNAGLIAVNQDSLGVQAALYKAYPIGGAGGWSRRDVVAPTVAEPVQVPVGKKSFTGVTTCDFGYDVPAAQQAAFTSDGQIKLGAQCLLPHVKTGAPALGACSDASSHWELGISNETTAQIKIKSSNTCLKYIGGEEGTGLFLDACGTEPPICARTRCASSTLSNELWYLTRHGQLIASWTQVPIPPLEGHAPCSGWPCPDWNPPMCLASSASQHPPAQPPMPAGVPLPLPDISQCLQVWAGPLASKASELSHVVGLVNSCQNGSATIQVDWSEIGLKLGKSQSCKVRDLYAGKDLGESKGGVSAQVGEHDIAVLRLSCPSSEE